MSRAMTDYTKAELVVSTEMKLEYNQIQRDKAVDETLKTYYSNETDYYQAIKTIIEQASDEHFKEEGK